MADPIFMRIGEGSTVELPELVGAMGNFLGLLRDVDSTISDKRNGNLRWKVTTLRDDPSPLVGVTPFLHRLTIRDTSAQVEKEIINNVVSLTEKGERSKFFSDAALDKVERIAKTTAKIGESEIYTSRKGDLHLRTSVTVKTFNQVQELSNVRSVSYGTVIGSLDSISVHKSKEFRVWDENTNRPVRCRLTGNQLTKAITLLGSRVIVTGMVNSDRKGIPISMSVETLDGAMLRDLPPIDALMGIVPNLTGGLSIKEFLEELN
jgi:hypothetical protein